MGKVGSFHGGGLTPDAILLHVEEEGEVPGAKDGLGRSVMRDEPVHIVKLQMIEMELDCPPVQVCLRAIVRLKAEGEGDMD